VSYGIPGADSTRIWEGVKRNPPQRRPHVRNAHRRERPAAQAIRRTANSRIRTTVYRTRRPTARRSEGRGVVDEGRRTDSAFRDYLHFSKSGGGRAGGLTAGVGNTPPPLAAIVADDRQPARRQDAVEVHLLAGVTPALRSRRRCYAGDHGEAPHIFFFFFFFLFFFVGAGQPSARPLVPHRPPAWPRARPFAHRSFSDDRALLSRGGLRPRPPRCEADAHSHAAGPPSHLITGRAMTTRPHPSLGHSRTAGLGRGLARATECAKWADEDATRLVRRAK